MPTNIYVDEVEIGPYVDVDNIYVMFNVSLYEQMIDKQRHQDALDVLNKRKRTGDSDKARNTDV